MRSNPIAHRCGSRLQALLKAGIEIHCLRDLTRGGLSSGLIEIAETAQLRILIEETSIPVREDVAGACEILGLDPLYLANEGRFIAVVPEHETARALDVLSQHPLSGGAVRIGQVSEKPAGMVTMMSRMGTERITRHAQRRAIAANLLTAWSAPATSL